MKRHLPQPPSARYESGPRPVRVEDLPLVRQLLDDVFRRSRGVLDQSQLTDFPLVFSPNNLVNCRLIAEDGLVVSHAALWPRELICDSQRFKAAVVVSVATHPSYRLRGYAAALMRSLHDQLHHQSYDLAILWTAVPDFYRKLGWQLAVPRGVMVELDTKCTARIPVSEYQCLPLDVSLHLDQLLEIYDQNPIRLARNRNQAEQLLSLPKVPVWVATRAGRVFAYVCHGRAVNKRGVAEYGGELAGVLALLRHIVASLSEGESLPLLIYHTRHDLADWAHSLGLPTRALTSSKGTNHEMIHAVRPENMPTDLSGRIFVWGLDHA